MPRLFQVALLLVLLVSCGQTLPSPSEPRPDAPEEGVFAANARLGRGVNFGNALEAPREGDWGVTLSETLFERAREAGFANVRLPVAWSYHAAREAPYAIDQAFFERIDWALEQAKARGLALVLNVHHYYALNDNPTAERERYLAIWRQIAERYAAEGDYLYFELLNEPSGRFNEDPALWNALLAEALTVVREHHPERPVIVGPVWWNHPSWLEALELPDDPWLIVTVHLYDPFDFTHQGAGWLNPPPPVGREWYPEAPTLDGADWSWGITRRWIGEALEVTFTHAWSGLYVHREPLRGYDRLRLRSDRDAVLYIACSEAALPERLELRAHTPKTAALPCQVIREVRVMSDTPQTLVLSELTLVGPASEHPLLVTERKRLENQIAAVARWAEARNRPVYVGEFGAFERADLDSRVRWTSAVRELAEENGLSWAYWELAAGFGIYDQRRDTWSAPLLRALIPEWEP